ncbi:MAG: hypothetical protein ACM3TR_04750 [Caulobacteraceae bacterium]
MTGRKCFHRTFHKAFSECNSNDIRELCTGGKIGCVACKSNLIQNLDRLLSPIREKRKYYGGKPEFVSGMLKAGTEKARGIAKETMREIRDAMRIDYFNKL